MNSALKKLSRTDLIALLEAEKKTVHHHEQDLKKTIESYENRLERKEQNIAQSKHEIYRLKEKVAQLQRMLFGQKRERFERWLFRLRGAFRSNPVRPSSVSSTTAMRKKYLCT